MKSARHAGPLVALITTIAVLSAFEQAEGGASMGAQIQQLIAASADEDQADGANGPVIGSGAR